VEVAHRNDIEYKFPVSFLFGPRHEDECNAREIRRIHLFRGTVLSRLETEHTTMLDHMLASAREHKREHCRTPKPEPNT
jgi:hypothetical protein